MDREGLTVVPEASAPLVIARAGEPADNQAPARPHRTGTLRALHSKPFRLYFIGQVASASGTFLQQTAMGWLVLKLTGNAASLGLVLAAGGVVSIADSPARQAFISSLVTPDDLSSAVSLNGVVMNSARVVGPAIAGVLIATVGTTPCFGLNALSYIAVIVALIAIRPLTASAKKRKATGGVLDGLKYARGRQQLWLPLTMMALVGLLAFNFSVILPVLADKTFHGNGGTYGLLTTLLSVGSVAGSFAVGLVRHPRRIYLVFTALAFGVGLIATAFAPDVAVACSRCC